MSQGHREIIYNCNCPKLNALRKGKSTFLSQKENYLKLSQAEGNVKPVLGQAYTGYLD